MKKYLIRFGLVGTLTFLVLFIYFYKTSGKFRQSMSCAFVATTVYFSGLTPAHSIDQADGAFTQQNHQHQCRPHRGRGIFGRNPNNGGSGPGKPNGDGSDGDDVGIPKYPKTESVKQTEEHLEWIKEQVVKLQEETDSESEIETDSEESNIAPTSNLFSADSITGNIQDIDVAFNHFKERMTQIGNQYTGEKKEYFFEQLNQCGIERFKDLSTEKGRLTIYGVREAETMFQSEFEGFHEPNSITRPTDEEYQENNVFDGRFRKLSGKSNTLNEQYTEADAKLLVSEKTLQHQADERRRLGQKNPNKMSMYEQGKNMGYSIVGQKYKHCNPNKPELPSSPANVKHIINALELLPSETNIAKKGILDGARSALSDKLKVPESSISDQTALQGIIFLNEDYTIERVN